MVKNTQFFNGYSNNSSLIQLSVNSESGNSKDKNSQTISNTNSHYKSINSGNYKEKSNNVNKKGFDEILNSKKGLKKAEKNLSVNSNRESKNNKIEDKVNNGKKDIDEKLEDKKENDKKVNNIFEELLSALNILVKADDFLQIEQLNGNSDVLASLIEQITNDDKSNILTQLLEINSGDSLDFDKLKEVKNLLQQLSSNLDNDHNVDKGIGDIISKLNELLQDSNEQGKGIAISAEGFQQGSSSQKNDSGMLSNKSKEDKFLNSLIEDKNDSIDNKINLFASRTQNIKNENIEAKGLTINKPTFVSDLIKDVKYMNINNVKELVVKVNPGNLGEITIKLLHEDGLMKVNLKANSKETSDLLSQNLTEIKKELADQNIKVSEVNIDLYNEDTTFFKDQGFGGQLSQEQNNSKGESHNSPYIGLDINDENEVLEENLAILDNNLDFLA